MRTGSIIFLAVLFFGMATISTAQNSNKQIAQLAFSAWGNGEKNGNYNDFKKFLSNDFVAFSHPLLGKFSKKEALGQIQKLITERELKSNELSFSEIELIASKNVFVFLFNSQGTVSGGFPYQGFNAIVLTVDKNKLTGFREYFGFVDPNWFK